MNNITAGWANMTRREKTIAALVIAAACTDIANTIIRIAKASSR